jgi:cation diffusion facilitator CzcD-associated flavoprotein CzcO
MADTATPTAPAATAPPPATDVLDVLVVGAGISGLGAAYHLSTRRPGTRFVVLEDQASFGGTWITHRYPGIRSDSDLHTFGYRFKPWTGTPIATAEEILRYLDEVIRENDLARHIRYRHRVDSAHWSSRERCWTLQVTRLDSGERLQLRARFLWMCQGYYRHARGYTPQWPGMDAFGGRIVHPQTWPDDLDLAGKRVVIIGSGATAATRMARSRCATWIEPSAVPASSSGASRTSSSRAPRAISPNASLGDTSRAIFGSRRTFSRPRPQAGC